MESLTKKNISFIVLIVIILFLSLLLLNSPNIKHAPHLDDLDSGGFLDAMYALALASLVLFLAAGLGRIILKPFKLTDWTFIERTVISLPLGLAAIGYVEFFMGLLGWLKPIHHTLLLIIITIVSFRNSVHFLIESCSIIKQFPTIWRGFSFIKKFFFFVGALALLLAFLQTLTPPWDYDGLMYHLQGPRLFLDANRILPIYENWFTFYPSTWEMIYMLGMGLGNDVFSRIIHFSTLIILLFSTYAFGKRLIPTTGGFLPAAILFGIPVLLVWGISSYTDIAWALFQFQAIVLLLIWHKERSGIKRSGNLLILTGILQGLALGTKYLALSGAAILGVVIIVLSFGSRKGRGWKSILYNAILFGCSTLLVASPWYLKNLFWTGNPVFPYFLPQNELNPLEISLFMDYVNSFGTGKTWHDYALLPINIFLNFKRFGTFMGDMDIPNPLFVIVWFYPFFRKKIELTFRNTLDLFVLLTFLFFVVWAAGSQQTRFLTPIFPGLAIISGALINSLYSTDKKIAIAWIVKVGVVGGMVIVTLVMMVGVFHEAKPYMVTTGLVTKNDYLSMLVNNYSAIRYVNEHLPNNARVLMPWDGRGYYCESGKCLPDVDQNIWSVLVEQSEKSTEITEWLEKQCITHLLITSSDVSFFITGHDPEGIHQRAYEYLNNHLFTVDHLVYRDEDVDIFVLDNQ